MRITANIVGLRACSASCSRELTSAPQARAEETEHCSSEQEEGAETGERAAFVGDGTGNQHQGTWATLSGDVAVGVVGLAGQNFNRGRIGVVPGVRVGLARAHRSGVGSEAGGGRLEDYLEVHGALWRYVGDGTG